METWVQSHLQAMHVEPSSTAASSPQVMRTPTRSKTLTNWLHILFFSVCSIVLSTLSTRIDQRKWHNSWSLMHLVCLGSPLLEVKLRSMQVSDVLVCWLDYLIITTHQTTYMCSTEGPPEDCSVTILICHL